MKQFIIYWIYYRSKWLISLWMDLFYEKIQLNRITLIGKFLGKTRPFYWKTHPDNLGCFGPKNSKRWVFQKYRQAHPKIEISKRNWMSFPEKRFSITCGQWVQGVFCTFENVVGPEKDRINGNLIILHEFWGVTLDVLLENSSS